ncbi:TLP18.3, Psb32 and MOLO-1 founding protein of phosphatase [Tenacibaculum sp. MAR_2009_124]|uniref:TPM domain-containing protein n=1 Tax=Tenacibaculum sp. MAR_2009_124 TaxID=1250059 RepID=UPI000897741E|nr:TPM domain-containing protein [Tenacibaculum sp. MAR_2009_124]SED18114.1 TLP18.3, Psb32 and MOLO-1 founding protein of phosphatase [Tenacibaculum sp. MAR_2009_124]
MSRVEDFLSAKEEQEIVNAIKQAEKNTSGEIRVHIEATSKLPHYLRVQEVFQMLKMDNTKEHNAVLFYVAVEDRKFVVYGDEGINKVVPDNFWDTTKDAMQEEFQQGDFKQGIINGVLKAGEELKVHFPWQTDDEDELSNEISKA